MARLPTLKGNFAILDVTSGRKGLAKHFARKEPHPIPVPVVIHGYIDGVGHDDGTSTEFTVDVTGVTLGEVE